MVKERRGAGSVGMIKINKRELLPTFAANADEPLIVQPFIDAEQIDVDFYVDMISGEIVSAFAKEKLRMRAGEADKIRSINDEKLFALVERVSKAVNLRGPVDMDLFRYQGAFYVLEINPRFGGVYPHAHECGVNFIKNIAANARGERLTPNIGNYEADQVMLKYTASMMRSERELEMSAATLKEAP